VTGAEVAGDPLPSVMQALNETTHNHWRTGFAGRQVAVGMVNAPDLMPRVAKSCRKSW
jgi:hypothetical protein